MPKTYTELDSKKHWTEAMKDLLKEIDDKIKALQLMAWHPADHDRNAEMMGNFQELAGKLEKRIAENEKRIKELENQ